MLARILANRSVRHPDHFITAFYDAEATRENLTRLLATLADGFTEIMCHPGYVDVELMRNSIYTSPREREVEILTDPLFQLQIRTEGVTLTGFAGLPQL